jgi:hypothetical protein
MEGLLAGPVSFALAFLDRAELYSVPYFLRPIP